MLGPSLRMSKTGVIALSHRGLKDNVWCTLLLNFLRLLRIDKAQTSLFYRGVACLTINVRKCRDEDNASKNEHLQIAQTQMRRRKMRRLIRVCTICHAKHNRQY